MGKYTFFIANPKPFLPYDLLQIQISPDVLEDNLLDDNLLTRARQTRRSNGALWPDPNDVRPRPVRLSFKKFIESCTVSVSITLISYSFCVSVSVPHSFSQKVGFFFEVFPELNHYWILIDRDESFMDQSYELSRSLSPLILLDTSLYSKLLIKSFCFIFALGDSQSDIRLVSTRVNHSALT